MAITPEQARAELARRELVKRGVSVEKSQKVVQSIPEAVREALIESTRSTADTLTGRREGPINMAKALPATAGTALSLMGVPGGMTVGTTGGRQLSNAALISYGRPEEMPSPTSQKWEAAGSVLADLTAIPAINRKVFGSQIGRAEAGKVPPPQDIRSTPMALGQKTIGEFINDAIDSVKSAGGQGTPVYWKQIKDQVDRIYSLGKDQALTSLDRGRLKFLNAAVQSGLNKSVPGRAGPAASLAMSQKIPNAIMRGYKSLPGSVKTGAGIGAGATGTAGLVYELGKLLLGNRRQ